MYPICYVCESKVFPASGYSKSNILIIGDAPSDKEIENGRLFMGAAGNVLRQELALLKADAYRMSFTNLWYHAPNKIEYCFKASVNACLEEAKGKKAILLLGSDTCEYFTGYKVSDVSGLQVESNMLSAPIIYAMLQPSIVFSSKGVGEIRFALSNFVKHILEEGIL